MEVSARQRCLPALAVLAVTAVPAADLLPAGEPPGFPRCGSCPYVRTGPARICVACASRTFAGITARACPVCSQLLDTGGSCPNWLCADPERRISRIHAIGYQSGPLRRVISSYKYGGTHAWALIFSRLVLGWLEQHPAAAPDLIVANPAFTGPAATEFPHAETVLRTAARQDLLHRWPFDTAAPAAVVKLYPTAKSANATATAKRSAAAELRAALSVPDRTRTRGRRILVYDDICTTASQLNAVADCLIGDGDAARVEALVLARARWRRGS